MSQILKCEADNMSCKVFFVEDEVITREGIRDKVNWQASGFEFCGEAGDGEMALPLLRVASSKIKRSEIAKWLKSIAVPERISMAS